MRLKELREERHLTQNDIAKEIKTSQTNIGRWEKELNEPAASFLIRLADFFQCSIDYLLGREGRPREYYHTHRKARPLRRTSKSC